MNHRIPFNRPALAGNELEYIADAIARGKISGDGHYTKLCQDVLKTELGAQAVLLTTSCTHALEMSALLLRIRPGDEVIVPSFTFVSTANAFVLRGARIVFADIRPDTLNIDEMRLERLISPRTKTIVVVHYAGVGCEMERVVEIAASYGIPVIEDNAHGLFGAYRGKPLGSFGCLATQSFHETKNLSCGEGGALVINDPKYTERAEILREKGTNRTKFFRGQIDRYTWVDSGSSYVMSDCLAAMLFAQLERRCRIQAVRERLWNRYAKQLAMWARNYGVGLPNVPEHCRQAFHMFYLLMPQPEDRDALISDLEARGILAVFHYVPLHSSPMGIQQGWREGLCPVAESVASRIVRLPFYYDLAEPDQQEVIQAVCEFRPGREHSLFALSRAIGESAAVEAAVRV